MFGFRICKKDSGETGSRIDVYSGIRRWLEVSPPVIAYWDKNRFPTQLDGVGLTYWYK